MNTPDTPVPVYREWASVHGTPWEVTFPKRGAVPVKRRFFPTEDAAREAVKTWLRGDASTGLPKRVLDEVLYVRSLLPSGVTLTDLWRFYAQHHDGLVSATVKVVADAYLLDMKRTASAKYAEEQGRVVGEAVAHFGPETLFSSLAKPTLLKFIKAPDSYWNRYARKRAVRCLITKARELDALKLDPLDGWVFEDAPKATPHVLKPWEVQAILDYALAHKPELVASFALQFFAGIRTEELCRPEEDGKRPLKWSDLTFGSKIEVPIEVSKTDDRRVITFWPAALTHWLNAVESERTGVVCPVVELDDAKSKMLIALNRERKQAKLPLVDFKQNDFRRTYASNAYALHGSAVQDWMGHQDGRMLKKHYRDHVEKTDATLHFESKPAALHSNVVALTA